MQIDLTAAIAPEPLVVSPHDTVLTAVAQMTQGSAATAPVQGCTEEDLWADLYQSTRSSCVVVLEAAQVVGILTQGDVVRLNHQRSSLVGVTVAQSMSQPVVTLRQSALTDLPTVMALLQRHRIQHLPVLNDQDRLIGVVTYKSLLTVALGLTVTAPSPIIPSALSSPEFASPDRRFIQQITDISPTALYVHDVQAQRNVYANQATTKLLGYTPEAIQALGTAFVQTIMHPEDLMLFCKHLEQLETAQDGEILTFEYRMRHASGEWRWLYSQDTVFLRDAEGRLKQILGTALDISDRKRTEQEMRQLKERLQFVLAVNPAVLFACKPYENYGVTFISKNIQTLTGYTPAEFLAETNFWASHIHPDDAPQIFAELPHLLAAGHHTHEYRFLCQNGNYHWLRSELHLVQNERGEPQEIVGYLADISDRKQIELNLAQSVKEVEDLYNHAPCGYHSLDGDGRLIKINDTELNWLGYSRDEVLGRSWSELITEESQLTFEQNYLLFKQQGWIRNLEFDLRCKDGRVVPVLLSATAVTDAAGNYLYSRSTTYDIRDRKYIQQQLQASEAKLQAILNFAPFIIFVKDLDGRYTLVNQAFLNLFSCTLTDVIGKTDHQFFSTDIADQLQSNDRLLLETDTISQFEETIQIGDTCHHFLSSKFLLRHCNGEAYALCSMATDISEIKQAERVLQESQQFIQTILDTVPIAVFWKDRNSTYLGCNTVAAKIAGVESSEHLLGKTDYDMSWDLATIEAARTEDRQVMDSGEPQLGLIDKISKGDGTYLWTETNKVPLCNSAGRVIGVLGTAQDITARRQAEEQLRDLSDRLALAVEVGAIGIWDWDMIHEATWDQRMYEIYGLQDLGRPAVYQDWLDRLHLDDREVVEIALQAAIQGQGSFDVAFRIWHTNGELRWVQAAALVQRNAQGIPIRVVGINRDITQQKQAEQAIRQQAEREYLLREITQRVRQSLDLQTIFEIACTEIRQAIQADRVGIFKLHPEANFEEGEFVAESVVAGFPSVMAIRIYDRCLKDDFPSSYIQNKFYAMDDIQTNQSASCYKNILAQLGIRANLAIPLLCGDQLWGLLCVHQCTTPRHWQRNEVDLTYQLSTQLAIAIQQAHLFEQLQQELTERQQAQQQLLERNQQLAVTNTALAHATRLKDEFLANMSHELRTPLNSILGMTEGLQDQVFGPITERQLKALKTIERSGLHLLSLINDILDVAKIESGQITLDYTTVSVKHLCESSLTFIQQQALRKGIQLQTQLPPHLPKLWADERRIRQVLINLLTNAVKFTPEAGRVILAAFVLCTDKDNPSLCITVTDTGIGISPDNIPKLFQPFTQIDSALNRQHDGTGLGLTLVKRLVELHGGEVSLTSEVGVGSCFTITLPLVQPVDIQQRA